MRWLAAAFLLLVTGAEVQAAGLARPARTPKLQSALKDIEARRYPAAARTLKAAWSLTGNDLPTALQVLELQGVLAVSQGQLAKASATFEALLILSPEYELSNEYPAKVIRAYAEARSSASRRGKVGLTASRDRIEVRVNDPTQLGKLVRFYIRNNAGMSLVVDRPLRGRTARVTNVEGKSWWAELLTGPRGAPLASVGEAPLSLLALSKISALTKPGTAEGAPEGSQPAPGASVPAETAAAAELPAPTPPPAAEPSAAPAPAGPQLAAAAVPPPAAEPEQAPDESAAEEELPPPPSAQALDVQRLPKPRAPVHDSLAVDLTAAEPTGERPMPGGVRAALYTCAAGAAASLAGAVYFGLGAKAARDEFGRARVDSQGVIFGVTQTRAGELERVAQVRGTTANWLFGSAGVFAIASVATWAIGNKLRFSVGPERVGLEGDLP